MILYLIEQNYFLKLFAMILSYFNFNIILILHFQNSFKLRGILATRLQNRK